MEYLKIAPYTSLLSHSRFQLTLRSDEGKYHSLILFRLSSGSDAGSGAIKDDPASATSPALVEEIQQPGNSANSKQLYAMEASCPHLGADLSHAEIEECEDSMIAVCPWHRYDFDLKTGKSETGLKACTYNVDVRKDASDGSDQIWLQQPEGGKNWMVVELRPVSEEFADPPPLRVTFEQTAATPDTIPILVEDEPLTPLENPPKTLMQWAVLILNTSNPTLKVQRTRHASHLFRTAQLTSIGNKSTSAPRPPDVPPREEGFAKNTMDKTMLKNKRNQASILHALGNIEQWAIDLAWDIMARFGPSHPELPPAFFSDFTRMALDESKHFTLLTKRLSELSPSTPYGSMPVHAGLWDSASTTSTSLLSRLAIIHLVHEARGLDVNPRTIERFRKAGDLETVKVMEVIHNDEVTHVTTGHRWFTWLCEREGVDPVKRFREEVRRGWMGEIRGPFNEEARSTAGMTREFYVDLRGEMGAASNAEKPERIGGGLEDVGKLRDALAETEKHVSVGYEEAR